MADQKSTALPKRSHNARRVAWLGILTPYGIALGLLVWNWW